MRIPFFQVDAFTQTPFRGNPAAVCLLDHWPDDPLLQHIAAENNLAETAFVVTGDGAHELRWFTPTTEVDLCGHATLAAASVLFDVHPPSDGTVKFGTRQAGPLTVTRDPENDGQRFWMNFPARPATPCPVPAELPYALDSPVVSTHAARDLLVELSDETAVRTLRPDHAALKLLNVFAICVTAPADDPAVDFVSRFFAPRQGINEDSVTGSAHCTLAPHWAGRLHKTELTGHQVSPRGGTVHCRLHQDRIDLGGHVVRMIEGTLTLPGA